MLLEGLEEFRLALEPLESGRQQVQLALPARCLVPALDPQARVA
jgi:hypothetical protein